jgi:hypothetical protein
MKKGFLVRRGSSGRGGKGQVVVLCTEADIETIRKLDGMSQSRQDLVNKSKAEIQELIDNKPTDWTTSAALSWAYHMNNAVEELTKLANPNHHEYIYPGIEIEDIVIFESLGEYIL